MYIFLLRRCSERQKQGVEEILSNDKFALITVNPEEGVTNEITQGLNNRDLFNLYRKFRKKYFKIQH